MGRNFHTELTLKIIVNKPFAMTYQKTFKIKNKFTLSKEFKKIS